MNKTKPFQFKQTLVFLGFFIFMNLIIQSLCAFPEDIGGSHERNDRAMNIERNFQSTNLGIPLKIFSSVLVDEENKKWFLTESGIVSFDGEKWELHNENSKIIPSEIRGIAFQNDTQSGQIWLATENGIKMITLPVNSQSASKTYDENSAPIPSKNVAQVVVGNNHIRWFGTDKGVSALKGDEWLTPDYEEFYPEFIFQEFPILSMATNFAGDSLYVGTRGAGIARVYSNEVDGISGASVLAQWGPMILPSDNVYSIYISKDGSKWFGTDLGVARHTGTNSLDNWTSYTTEDGLINNFVQAITSDKDGKIWLGTKGGISVFDGKSWQSYTQNDGLISNNVLCIAVDKSGVIWIGTDNGVSSLKDSAFTNYSNHFN